jgi:hypothetical protein
MANRRNIRKRQFESNKYLKLYRNYADLYHYLNGENANESDMKAFELQEKYENKDKIAEMFCKKKRDVVIPEINLKNDKGDSSEKSANTDITMLKNKEEEKGVIDFKFKHLGGPPTSYIKYKPRIPPLGLDQNYDKLDFLMTQEHWVEVQESSKNITEDMMDITEEIFDKLEKFTAKGEVQSLDRCKQFIPSLPMVNKIKFPTDGQFKAIYNAWINLRKKTGNALTRIFYKKPDPNDSNPTASFRSRVPERMQTRRKNKNDKNNYMKLKVLRREIYQGRQLMGDVMKREKLKMTQLDLEYMELTQHLKEKIEPGYQCPQFLDFVKNEEQIMKLDLPEELAEPYRNEDEDMYEEEKDTELKGQSQFDVESMKSSKFDKKMSKKDSMIDKGSVLGPDSDANSDNFSNPDPPARISQMSANMPPVVRHLPTNEKAVVDPTTIMQIAIIFNKLHYNGLQVDKDRIKISTHKPIKKEDYLNLSKTEVEKENYYRSGIKPKADDKAQSDETPGVKYTIFMARNGRVHILRKAKNGQYQTHDQNNSTAFTRIQPEVGNSIKRLKICEDDEYEGIRNTVIPVLQKEVSDSYSPWYNFDNSESDEEMTDDTKEKENLDDYTEGFINRHRKRKGKKRTANDLTISFKV